ncbi:hypothetical protein EDB87DRAFT_425481 [Lactarius vividus]|nr:hypothetical protein EDB87DRAFT_425481 [Lactarius vividus]
MWLHTSVFLFFAGLVDFFLLFNESVAWVFIEWLGLFASLYTELTVIPNTIPGCPYGTPFTSFLWGLSQMLAVVTLVFTGVFPTILDGFFQYSRGIWGRIYRGAPTSFGPRETGEADRDPQTLVQQRFPSACHVGREQRLVIGGQRSADLDTFKAQRRQDYLSRILGFFNSRVVPGASQTMLRLMGSPSGGADPVLAVRLGGLLKTCLPTSSGVDPGVDKNRLSICLTAIWYT